MMFDKDDNTGISCDDHAAWAERISSTPNRKVWWPKATQKCHQLIGEAFKRTDGKMVKKGDAHLAGIPEALNVFVADNYPELKYPSSYFDLPSVRYMEKKIRKLLVKVVTVYSREHSGAKFDPNDEAHHKVNKGVYAFMGTVC
jgi:hypothetical protein